MKILVINASHSGDKGHTRPITQRKANQEILPLHFFGMLKRLPVKILKIKFVERAREIQAGYGID